LEKVLEKKAPDVDLTVSLFRKLAKRIFLPPVFLKGLAPVIQAP
jgi:hypothetical protein